jgi:hypothetical protein
MSLAELGRLAEAAEYEAEAIRLAEPTHHAFTAGQAHRAAGTLRRLKGDWTEARSLLEHGIAVFRTGRRSHHGASDARRRDRPARDADLQAGNSNPLHWREPGAKIPGQLGLAALDFSTGTLILTEAGTVKRAALHLLRGEEDSDEILHRARLSPVKLNRQLSDEEAERLRAHRAGGAPHLPAARSRRTRAARACSPPRAALRWAPLAAGARSLAEPRGRSCPRAPRSPRAGRAVAGWTRRRCG